MASLTCLKPNLRLKNTPKETSTTTTKQLNTADCWSQQQRHSFQPARPNIEANGGRSRRCYQSMFLKVTITNTKIATTETSDIFCAKKCPTTLQKFDTIQLLKFAIFFGCTKLLANLLSTSKSPIAFQSPICHHQLKVNWVTPACVPKYLNIIQIISSTLRVESCTSE